MKKYIMGLLLSGIIFSVYGTNLSTGPEENLTPLSPDVPPAPSTGCARWKQICYKKTYCTNRQGLREGCYRCVNTSQFGFHLYPREMERTSCNQDTVDYLQTMGYRCYMPYKNSPCLHTAEQEVCDWTCADSSN